MTALGVIGAPAMVFGARFLEAECVGKGVRRVEARESESVGDFWASVIVVLKIPSENSWCLVVALSLQPRVRGEDLGQVAMRLGQPYDELERYCTRCTEHGHLSCTCERTPGQAAANPPPSRHSGGRPRSAR